jgi:uncharacterized protein YkwD
MPRAFPHRGVLSLTRRTLMPYVMVASLLLVPTGVTTAATYGGDVTTSVAPSVVTAGTIGAVSARSYLLEVRPSARKQVRRINRARERNGLDPVRLHRCLTDKAAQPWARRMARTGDFRHQELSDVQKDCSRFGWMGENIAYGYPTASAVMEAWMNSSGHRANILRPQFTHVGVGVKRDASGRRYWVQNFGG